MLHSLSTIKPSELVYGAQVLVSNDLQKMQYIYILFTKCEVKMAGYWPSSLFAFLWTESKVYYMA